jgi:hypothetical protein
MKLVSNPLLTAPADVPEEKGQPDRHNHQDALFERCTLQRGEWRFE